jgi:hypothetical protein
MAIARTNTDEMKQDLLSVGKRQQKNVTGLEVSGLHHSLQEKTREGNGRIFYL